MRYVLLRIVCICLVLGLAPRAGQGGEGVREHVLVNPAFERWEMGAPVGWTLSLGAARDPRGPLSAVVEEDGGGLALVGNERTRRWQLVAQRYAVTPGQHLTVRFEARARELASSPEAFSSHYVGVAFEGTANKVLGLSVQDVTRAGWHTKRFDLKVPLGAKRAVLRVFLSRPGRLSVKRVDVAVLGPEASFEVVRDDMALHYPSLAAHKIDWPELTRFHAQEAEVASNPFLCAEALTLLLARLRDEHVFLQMPDGTKRPTWRPKLDVHFDLNRIAPKISDTKIERGVLLQGTLREDGLPYLLVDALPGDRAPAQLIEQAFRAAAEAPGVLIDLRTNSGGAERSAQRAVRWLADKERIYARTMMRDGPDPKHLREVPPRRIVPPPGWSYERPVVVLIGPGCVSSGEGMALMLRALPHALLVGRATRGASGKPVAVPLPNGLTLWRSSWRARLPSGAELERYGVPPDERVNIDPERDAVFEAGVRILRARVAAARSKEK